MSDDLIWHCIRHNHCSFMAKSSASGPFPLLSLFLVLLFTISLTQDKTCADGLHRITTGIFCRNPYNATGICNRSSCPLANSRYATIRDHEGVFYLYMKTAERAHMPNKLWERVKLPRNCEIAMDVINKHLEFWPKLLVHKIKQRLTKMTQYRIRMRKLQLKVREKVMTVPRKKTMRDARRLDKAEKAAQLEKNIESELKERLRKGVYGEIYNIDFKEFNEILDIENREVALEQEDEEEEGEIEYVEGDDDMEEMDDMEDMEDIGGLSDGGTDEDDHLDEPAGSKPKGLGSDLKRNAGKRSRKVITEVEQDEEAHGRQRTRM